MDGIIMYQCLRVVKNYNFRIVLDFNEKAKKSDKKIQESEKRKLLAVGARSLIINYARSLPAIPQQRADLGWNL